MYVYVLKESGICIIFLDIFRKDWSQDLEKRGRGGGKEWEREGREGERPGGIKKETCKWGREIKGNLRGGNRSQPFDTSTLASSNQSIYLYAYLSIHLSIYLSIILVYIQPLKPFDISQRIILNTFTGIGDYLFIDVYQGKYLFLFIYLYISIVLYINISLSI